MCKNAVVIMVVMTWANMSKRSLLTTLESACPCWGHQDDAGNCKMS